MVSQDSAAQADERFAERMKARLIEPSVDDALLSALEQFSGPMLDELLGRIATIESKAINILGWSTALLGFLLLQQSPAPGRWLTVLAAVLALGASSVAARATKYVWPTVRHWFCEEEFGAPLRLRALHLTELLTCYLQHRDLARRKAVALQVSQWAILAAGVLVALTILFGG